MWGCQLNTDAHTHIRCGHSNPTGPQPEPGRQHHRVDSDEDVVVTMTNNATYHLDVDSVEFCFGTYCRSTLKVHREDGAGLEFQKHEIDAIDGPSTKVLWLNSCSIPDFTEIDSIWM